MRFSVPTGHSVAFGRPENDYVDIRLMALSTGKYVDMQGQTVVVNTETLDKIASRYNRKTTEDYNNERMINADIGSLADFDNRNGPVQLGHNDNNPRETVGHILGLMEVVHEKDKSYLFMKVRIKGKENVPMVLGKTARWRNVSVQYVPNSFEFIEVSFVVKGADITARTLLSQYNNLKTTILENDKKDAIALAERTIKKYNSLIEAEKYLLASCKAGIITKATANMISSKLNSFSEPLEAVKLAVDSQPTIKFNPLFISKEHTKNMLTKLGG